MNDKTRTTLSRVLAHAEETEQIRTTWKAGRITAASAAADLREGMRKLTELRHLPRVKIPSPDPADWWEEPAVPSFPFVLPDPAELFDPLIAHFQLMAHRYDEAVLAFAKALADLDEFTAPDELRGCMDDGYTPEQVNSVLGQLSEMTGLRLVCIWDYYDEDGYGGNSGFYIEALDGHSLFDLVGDLWAWLNKNIDDPDAPTTPGDPRSWIGDEVSGVDPTDLGGDGFHNYANQHRR
ncbi:hypothetical protein [Nocardia carnea]|uniref:hypothetical protein n=1 Tax=Nocardia carnea TaxID=37328 RepID=UPI0024554DC6|nr:hypothetical protein [Nocardia carnea]